MSDAVPGAKSAHEPRSMEAFSRGLRVIEAFSDARPRMSLSELSAQAGLTPSATRRYLHSLVHGGYAATDGRSYWLLPRVLRLGQAYLDGARVPKLVQPFLHEASARCGETLNLGALDGHEVVYLARSHAPQGVSIGYHTGARVPAHVVSMGVALLAELDAPALHAWMATHTFTRYTDFTPSGPQALGELVRQARANGYGQTEQFVNFGLCGLALALTDRQGRASYGLSVTMQCQRWPDPKARAERLLPVLREVAQSLRPLL